MVLSRPYASNYVITSGANRELRCYSYRLHIKELWILKSLVMITNPFHTLDRVETIISNKVEKTTNWESAGSRIIRDTFFPGMELEYLFANDPGEPDDPGQKEG